MAPSESVENPAGSDDLADIHARHYKSQNPEITPPDLDFSVPSAVRDQQNGLLVVPKWTGRTPRKPDDHQGNRKTTSTRDDGERTLKSSPHSPSSVPSSLSRGQRRDPNWVDAPSVVTIQDLGNAVAELEYYRDKPQPTSKEDRNEDLVQIGSSFEDVQMSLKDRFRTALLTKGGENAESSTKWLPFDVLFEYTAFPEVLRELQRAFQEDLAGGRRTEASLREYAKKIGDHEDQSRPCYRRVFAILVMMGDQGVSAILEFVDAGLSDEYLPLKPLPTDGSTSKPYRFMSPSHSDKEWDVGRKWDQSVLDLFCLYQRRVLSPYFDFNQKGIIPFFPLDSRTILPFIEYGLPKMYGYHGEVREVKLHPAHHNAWKKTKDNFNPPFALKELRSGSREIEKFREEVTAIAKSTSGPDSPGRPHLIKLLAAWSLKGRFYLLFPLAKQNLQQYWDETEVRRHDVPFVQWVAKQCLGLAQGLRLIHRPHSSDENRSYGIHEDLKPENILHSEDPSDDHGILTISDFGFTHFHRKESRSETLSRGHSATYLAPEQEMGKDISRRTDIWALACIYLEFATWLVAGPEGLQKFSENRVGGQVRGQLIHGDNFFTSSGQTQPCPVVNPAVNEWIDYLLAHEHCSMFVSDFLDLIKNDLLVIEKDKRKSCTAVVDRLDAIYKRCLGEKEEYCCPGRLRPPQRETTVMEPGAGAAPELENTLALREAVTADHQALGSPIRDLPQPTSASAINGRGPTGPDPVPQDVRRASPSDRMLDPAWSATALLNRVVTAEGKPTPPPTSSTTRAHLDDLRAQADAANLLSVSVQRHAAGGSREPDTAAAFSATNSHVDPMPVTGTSEMSHPVPHPAGAQLDNLLAGAGDKTIRREARAVSAHPAGSMVDNEGPPTPPAPSAAKGQCDDAVVGVGALTPAPASSTARPLRALPPNGSAPRAKRRKRSCSSLLCCAL